MTLHDLFTQLEADNGKAGLHSLYDEGCKDSPALCVALESHGCCATAIWV